LLLGVALLLLVLLLSLLLLLLLLRHLLLLGAALLLLVLWLPSNIWGQGGLRVGAYRDAPFCEKSEQVFGRLARAGLASFFVVLPTEGRFALLGRVKFGHA
jgi:hypothetical protein